MNKNKFNATNLMYVIECDYDRTYCTCHESICRCTKLENTRIEELDVDTVLETLYKKYSVTDSYIDLYCFNRICYKFEIYDKDNYWIETCGGYYGEEIEGVWFENEEKVYNAFKDVLACETDAEKIKYILRLEYGYLTEAINEITKAEVVETTPDRICPPQSEYLRKVSGDIIEAYRNWKLPIGVCTKNEDKYKLIDGYHRFVANNSNNTVEVISIE